MWVTRKELLPKINKKTLKNVVLEIHIRIKAIILIIYYLL